MVRSTPMKKPTRAKPGEPRQPKKRESTPCLFLGCFSFDRPGDEEWTGTFQLVVEATGPENAVDRCRVRLRRMRTNTTLFDNPVTIYLDGLIRLTGSFQHGLLVNWESGPSPPPPNGTLSCLIPEQTDHSADAWGWEPTRRKKGDDHTIEPFLDFGGEKFRRALAAAKSGGANAKLDHAPTRSATIPIPLTQPRTVPRKDAAAAPSATPQPSASKAAAEAKREETRTRKVRREALAATVAELRASNKKRGDSPR
jgi:hypothetical protein